jgi:hypothetical protein
VRFDTRGTILAELAGMALFFSTPAAPPALAACQVCGWTTLQGLELCIACLDVREWSRVNRAFCDLLHRAWTGPGRPAHAAPGLAGAPGDGWRSARAAVLSDPVPEGVTAAA